MPNALKNQIVWKDPMAHQSTGYALGDCFGRCHLRLSPFCGYIFSQNPDEIKEWQ
jgi:hypothetical protein